MSRFLPLALAASLTVVALPARSAEFRSINRINVSASSPSDIVVSGNARRGARSYWCAAADYALRGLGLGFTDRLFVSQAYDRGTRSAAFTTSGTRTKTQGSVTVTSLLATVGASQSVGQARDFCPDRDFPNRG